LVEKEERPKDWRKTYLDALAKGEVPKATTLWHLKDYIPIGGVLYRKGQEGLLMRCVSREGLAYLTRTHSEVCGADPAITLYRRMQRIGVYWPEMAEDAKGMQ
jgi:hypothetical protein